MRKENSFESNNDDEDLDRELEEYGYYEGDGGYDVFADGMDEDRQEYFGLLESDEFNEFKEENKKNAMLSSEEEKEMNAILELYLKAFAFARSLGAHAEADFIQKCGYDYIDLWNAYFAKAILVKCPEMITSDKLPYVIELEFDGAKARVMETLEFYQGGFVKRGDAFEKHKKVYEFKMFETLVDYRTAEFFNQNNPDWIKAREKLDDVLEQAITSFQFARDEADEVATAYFCGAVDFLHKQLKPFVPDVENFEKNTDEKEGEQGLQK